MRAVPLFLRARAVVNFLMWAASTLEITNDEQRALRKFSAIWNLSLLKLCYFHQVADKFKTGEQAYSKANQHVKPFLVQPFPAYTQLCLVWFAVWCKITSLSFTRVRGWTLNGIWSVLRPCLQASRFPLKGVKNSPPLQAKNLQVGLPRYLFWECTLAGQFQ